MSELSNEQALQEFLIDIDCLNDLLPWTEKFNIFDVLKISRMEIRHSNVLAWLLNPGENHGLGDVYLRGVMKQLIENDVEGRYDKFELLSMNMQSFSIYREYKHIDILLVSSEEKIVIAIENKVGSSEHSDQLNRYRLTLEDDYPEYQKVYMFLTPYGDEPSDDENWSVFTYDEVVDILESVYQKLELQPDVSLLIRNYIEIIRRNIVEDKQLIEKCNEIYNKHKKALDLIFENCKVGESSVSKTIKDTLGELAKEGKIEYEREWDNNVFVSTKMNEILPDLEEPISSSGAHNIYAYQIYWNENTDKVKLMGAFSIFGQNVSKEKLASMEKMATILKPNKVWNNNFGSKKLYGTRWYEINDTDEIEVEVEKIVRVIVRDLLDMQDRLLAQIK